MDKYIWRKDGTQLRISYIADRGGVEVVNGNGDTIKEVGCGTAQAKSVINHLVVEFENK